MKNILMKDLMKLKVLKNVLFLFFLNSVFCSPCIGLAFETLYTALICKYSHYHVVIRKQNPKYVSSMNNNVLVAVANAYFIRREC